ncbi:MAG: Spy/CpxP family protein refolding chaperone [Alphaproteobacteria bacterium]|nr:Spy/CpxP family protein refolding chaperone [Alphaproteobacteria bacterium]
MKRKTIIATAAALAIGGAVGLGALTYGADALAQGRGPGGRMAHFQRMCADGPARLAGMLAYTETKLNLRAEQRPAWNQLADAVRAGTAPMQRLCANPPAAPEPGDIVGRLDMGERFMTASLESIRIVRPALAQFQATLSPEQREVVAQMMSRMGPGGRGGMRGWHHGRGERGGPGGPGFGRGPGGPGAPEAPANAPAAPAAPSR